MRVKRGSKDIIIRLGPNTKYEYQGSIRGFLSNIIHWSAIWGHPGPISNVTYWHLEGTDYIISSSVKFEATNVTVGPNMNISQMRMTKWGCIQSIAYISNTWSYIWQNSLELYWHLPPFTLMNVCVLLVSWHCDYENPCIMWLMTQTDSEDHWINWKIKQNQTVNVTNIIWFLR